MARDDLLLIIDQERDVKSKRLDALSDLANLFVAMNPGVSRVGFVRWTSDLCVGRVDMFRTGEAEAVPIARRRGPE